MGKVVRVLAVLLLVAGAACSDDGDDDDEAGTEPSTETVAGGIGLPGNGQVAWHFVGRIDQDALTFTAYGYLTQVAGLDAGELFGGNGEANEDNAVFSVVMTSDETSRSKLNNVTVIDVTGKATIYFNESADRTFGDSATFATGTEIGTASVSGQNILNIDPENRDKAVAAATAELTQTAATRFTLGGTEHQLGRKGLTERLTVSGQGVRTDPNGPKSNIEVAGTMTITG